MQNRRGAAGGFPAPMPGRDRPWTCEGEEFSTHGIDFRADGKFNGPEGLVFNWQDEFFGPIGDVVLSKEAGPNGHLQLRDRSVIWVNRDAEYWYTVTVLALPAPLVKYDPPPREPEERSLILSSLEGTDFTNSWFIPLTNGAFECNGFYFDAVSEIDFTNPMSGERVRRKAASGVVCIDSDSLRNVFVFARPGLKRILGHPSGWFQIKLGYRVKSLNTWTERFLWSVWPKILILLFTIGFWPIAFFTVPVLHFLHYHSGKLNLPSSFVNNEEVRDYYSEFRTNIVVEATHITFGDLMP